MREKTLNGLLTDFYRAQASHGARRGHPLRTPECPSLGRFGMAIDEGWTLCESEHMAGCCYCQSVLRTLIEADLSLSDQAASPGDQQTSEPEPTEQLEGQGIGRQQGRSHSGAEGTRVVHRVTKSSQRSYVLHMTQLRISSAGHEDRDLPLGLRETTQDTLPPVAWGVSTIQGLAGIPLPELTSWVWYGVDCQRIGLVLWSRQDGCSAIGLEVAPLPEHVRGSMQIEIGPDEGNCVVFSDAGLKGQDEADLCWKPVCSRGHFALEDGLVVRACLRLTPPPPIQPLPVRPLKADRLVSLRDAVSGNEKQDADGKRNASPAQEERPKGREKRLKRQEAR